MAVTKVQATGGQGTGGSPTATFGSAPTSGNILLAACFQASSTALVMDGTNSTSTGWTRISTVNGGSGGTTHTMALWIKTAGVSESSTVTCFSGANSGYGIEIAEYAPGGTIGTNVTAATAAFNSGNPQITPSITPTAGQAGVIFCVSAVRSSSVQTWSSISITGLTTTNEDHQQSANPAATVLYDAFPTSTSGSYQGTATATTSTSGDGVIVFVPVTSGTQNLKTLTAALIPAGAEPTQQTNKLLAAALPSTGSITRNIFHMIAAALSAAGNLTKALTKTALTASLQFAGALTASRLYARTLTASMALTGAITRQTGKLLTAALIGAGALTRAVKHIMTAALSGAGSLVRKTSHALAGALSATGALTRSTSRILAAALASAGGLAKKTATTLSGALSAAGDLATQLTGGIHNYTQSLTASLALSGSLPKQLSTTITAALLPAGAVFKKINKSFTGPAPAYALVGTQGAENTTGITGGDLTNLAWGTGENRSANNLLVLAVQCYGTATLPAAPSGWLIAAQQAGTSCSASIFYRYAAGGDAVPTVTGVTGGILYGSLTEFSGNATASVVDQTNTVADTTSPLVLATPSTDATSGELNIWTNAAPFSISTAINPITVVCNNGNSHGLAQNPSAAVNHYETYYAITTTNSGADSWTYTPNTTTNIIGQATALVTFKLGSGLISLGLSGAVTRTYGKVFAAAVAFTGALTRGIAHTITAALSGAGAVMKGSTKKVTGSLQFTGNVTKSTLKAAFAAALSYLGNISTTLFQLTGVTFNAALALAGNTTKYSQRVLSGALGFSGSVARAFPVLFAAALGMAGDITRFISKNFNASLPLPGAMGKTMYQLYTAALSFAGSVSTVVGHVTQQILTAMLGLGSRGTYDDTIMGDGPVLYVTHLDTDSMGTHTVTHIGSPTTRAMPNGDDAMQFNGTNQYVSVADATDLSVPNTNALTLEAWVTPSALNMPTSIVPTGYVNLIGKASWWSPPAANQYEYELRYFNQNTTESPSANPPEAFSGYAYNSLNGGIGFGWDDRKGVTVGTWAHLVIVYDSTSSPSRVSIYRDGVLANSTTFTGKPQNGSAPFTIGSCETGELTHSYWYGGIGKVAVYPRVLTSAEILEHYKVMTLGAPPVSVLFLQFGKIFSGSVGLVGSIKRKVSTTIQAALTYTGNVTRKTSHKIAATLKFAGSVLTNRGAAIVKSLTASLGLAGAVTRNITVAKVLGASLAMTGKLTRGTGKLLAAAISTSSAMVKFTSTHIQAGLGVFGEMYQRHIQPFVGPAMDLPTYLVIKASKAFAKLRSANVKVRAKDDPSNADVKPDDTDLWND